ncbi:hypothetical protein BN440_1859 [Erwinia amylovora MR1]|nr:hypothetical protein BN440_1859 [Erwinia amylovora MR1]
MLLINRLNIIDKYGGLQAKGQTTGRSDGAFCHIKLLFVQYYRCAFHPSTAWRL